MDNLLLLALLAFGYFAYTLQRSRSLAPGQQAPLVPQHEGNLDPFIKPNPNAGAPPGLFPNEAGPRLRDI
jgi:hypothetical protein